MSEARKYRHEPAFMVICSDGDYVLESKYAELMAENESLRKDAERYRWLREQCYYSHVQVIEADGSMPYVYGEELDHSVDFMLSAISSPENPS